MTKNNTKLKGDWEIFDSGTMALELPSSFCEDSFIQIYKDPNDPSKYEAHLVIDEGSIEHMFTGDSSKGVVEESIERLKNDLSLIQEIIQILQKSITE